MMNNVVIALGSNIDKERNFPAAVQQLGAHCHLLAVSSVYETAPVGLLDQPSFFNAAVLLSTELDAAQLKAQVLSPIEQRLKRVRQANPNAPRTIDMDIVLFNDQVLDYVGEDGRSRHVPDKDLTRFAHVAVPVAELLPQMLHPESGEPLAVIAERLQQLASRSDKPVLQKRPDIQLAEATTPQFWARLDQLVATSEIVIDRPRGSTHPRYPSYVYAHDYGFLQGTTAMDGDGIDVWLGSLVERRVTAVICTIDLVKRDTEIKILLGCTPQEADEILAVHNNGLQAAILIARNDGD